MKNYLICIVACSIAFSSFILGGELESANKCKEPAPALFDYDVFETMSEAERKNKKEKFKSK